MDYFNFEFKVKSKLYGQTDCVVNDLERAIKTGFAPCGSGEDYKFTKNEIARLKSLAHNRMFITDKDYKRAMNAMIEIIKGDGNFDRYNESNKAMTNISNDYGWNPFQKQALHTELARIILKDKELK